MSEIKTPVGKLLLNEKQASQRLAVKESTLRVWRHLNQGPSYCKIGASVRYIASDLEKYIESCRVTVGS